MLSVWLFASKSLEDIRVARERFLWGFWDRDAGVKQRRNWRDFIRLFNRIKPFDIALFQITHTGNIHALGIVRRTYYDDQTLIWPLESERERVLFPWRVEFSFILFSKEPFVKHFIKIENYIDGYGIGLVLEHEFRRILSYINRRIANVEVNIK